LKPSAVESRLNDLLGGWKPAAPAVTLPPPPVPASTRRIRILDRPGAPQTELAVANLLCDRRDPDYFGVTIINALLTSGLGSRLYRRLRSEKGYAYGVRGSFAAFRFPGFWRAAAGVRTDTTGDSLSIILEELGRLTNELVPALELEDAKRAVVGRFALTLEDPNNIITNSYLRFRYGFSADYWDRYPAKIAAVTAGEMQAIARKYYDPARVQIFAAGDAAKIRGEIQKFGTVENA
jgi:zinc protease